MSHKKVKKKGRSKSQAVKTTERSGCPTALVTHLQVTQIVLTLLRILTDR